MLENKMLFVVLWQILFTLFSFFSKSLIQGLTIQTISFSYLGFYASFTYNCHITSKVPIELE